MKNHWWKNKYPILHSLIPKHNVLQGLALSQNEVSKMVLPLVEKY